MTSEYILQLFNFVQKMRGILKEEREEVGKGEGGRGGEGGREGERGARVRGVRGRDLQVICKSKYYF